MDVLCIKECVGWVKVYGCVKEGWNLGMATALGIDRIDACRETHRPMDGHINITALWKAYRDYIST